MKRRGLQTTGPDFTHPVFQRMIYQKQGHRLRGLIDRSHQPTSKVALYNKLKALGYGIR
ncbi:MAG: hypothetical protein P8L25_11630 [Paracoccaceae bacterium]|nr:hypothetical protein [Paracoccaceae bacterium]